jgi:hypothetical protein
MPSTSRTPAPCGGCNGIPVLDMLDVNYAHLRTATRTAVAGSNLPLPIAAAAEPAAA